MVAMPQPPEVLDYGSTTGELGPASGWAVFALGLAILSTPPVTLLVTQIILGGRLATETVVTTLVVSPLIALGPNIVTYNYTIWARRRGLGLAKAGILVSFLGLLSAVPFVVLGALIG